MSIDRTQWSGCRFCNNKCNTCAFSKYSVQNYGMKCISCRESSNYLHMYGKYCAYCGKPLTDEAWDELESKILQTIEKENK